MPDRTNYHPAAGEVAILLGAILLQAELSIEAIDLDGDRVSVQADIHGLYKKVVNSQTGDSKISKAVPLDLAQEILSGNLSIQGVR